MDTRYKRRRKRKIELKIDRDVNGARNIYLKNIGLDESL
jgi:transposase